MSLVYFDLTIGAKPVGRLTFRLFDDIVPKTALNFKCLSTGERGEHLSFKKSTFHRVIRGFMCQGGDFTKHNGTGGESIYGGKFADESFAVKHTKRGLLSMANAGPNTNGSQFFITFGPCPHLNAKHVVFGEVVGGHAILDLMEQVDTDGRDKPVMGQQIVIEDCGIIGPTSNQSTNKAVQGNHEVASDDVVPNMKKNKLDKKHSKKDKKSSKKSKKSSKKRKYRDSSSDSSSYSRSDSDDSSTSSSDSDSEESSHKRRKHKKHKREKRRNRDSSPQVSEQQFSVMASDKVQAESKDVSSAQEDKNVNSAHVGADIEDPRKNAPVAPAPSSNTYVGADGVLYKGRGQRRFRPPPSSDSRFSSHSNRFERGRGFRDHSRDRRGRDNSRDRPRRNNSRDRRDRDQSRDRRPRYRADNRDNSRRYRSSDRHRDEHSRDRDEVPRRRFDSSRDDKMKDDEKAHSGRDDMRRSRSRDRNIPRSRSASSSSYERPPRRRDSDL